jgi:hypothetical protein
LLARADRKLMMISAYPSQALRKPEEGSRIFPGGSPMLSKSVFSLVAMSLVAAGSATAGQTFTGGPAAKSDQLPELQCDGTSCSLKAITPTSPKAAHAAVPSPLPYNVGPPAGQRFGWRGAGYPSCQTLNIVPAPTGSAPYEYIRADMIPVPLGSTHATLLSSVQANISGGPSGSAGVVGLLQMRRSGTTSWVTVDASYIYTVRGNPEPTSLYGTASYQAFESLATLPGGTGVPDAIDVRLGTFSIFTATFTDIIYNAVCYGKLDVTF